MAPTSQAGSSLPLTPVAVTSPPTSTATPSPSTPSLQTTHQPAPPSNLARLQPASVPGRQGHAVRSPQNDIRKSLAKWLFNLAILAVTAAGLAFAYIQVSFTAWTAEKDSRDDCFNMLVGYFSLCCGCKCHLRLS